ncbi:TetR/AcrR family transcriptional regulator [Bowmanella yangjiangensis]|uniref:TetR/AcrR family transcriptional regulator n=1 Tax=Bowmanella yangjiangensis TaxID=2811230 RepID=A0ABS3CUY3_9ALTE|nr:TetR/AcrR family transcriptional regulator [Bowmanella yangjiangensis]MBN7819961.1 TetR/AcrR family transcriptional regulator [Bowmanella yangjiangensis]
MLLSKREQIVAEADRLFYQQGFEFTSFANIAEAVQISRGNFYYHFKSKDEILEAVIARRLANTQAMLDSWQLQGDSPRARIGCFIQILIANSSKILKFGCPIGTLSTELAKLNHQALDRANGLFSLFRQWLGEQLMAMEFTPQQADTLAMHLLARSQGIATLANAFNDMSFIEQEVELLNQWLDLQIQSLQS